MGNTEQVRILLVDDDQEATASLARGLKAAGLKGEMRFASTPEKGTDTVKEWDPHVAVIDLSLNEKEGVESGYRLLSAICQESDYCRVIVLTGHASISYGVRALNGGAASFIEKPADIPHLYALIQDGVRQSLMRRDFDSLKIRKTESEVGEVIVGKGAAVNKVRESILYAAQTSQSVLITGETGTGKGLCAQALHRFGPRASRKFVRYQPNYGNADLVNSDLFGHLKGAFTGAGADRRGLIAEADQGTLFLDEIDELPLETQVSLLGVMQDRKFRPLGSNKEEQVSFRLVCATNRNIEECLEKGKLRKDFFHRIAHLEIRLPALRERLEDIPALAGFILKNIAIRDEVHVFGFDEGALSKLSGFNWPGNVRELEAVVEGGVFKAQYAGRSIVKADDLELRAAQGRVEEGITFSESVKLFKLKLIQEALGKFDGNQVRAAESLGLDRSTMRRILARDSEE